MPDGGGETREDRWGYPVRTTSEACIVAINSYYHQVLAYGRKRSVILDAVKNDPTCVLANTLASHFLFSHDPSKALSCLNAASSFLENATSYEKAVFKTVSCLMDEEVTDASSVELHSELLKEFPKDLNSLKRVQILCFYMGRPDLSLELVEKVLPYNQEQSYAFGMLAFPLLELGRMADAEDAGRRGLEINKDDFWSQHAICHVYQNDCRFKEAVDFMEACSSSWILCSSFLYSHNWWHVAVCYLEGHALIGKVLDVYDYSIMKELEKIDADCGEVYLNALGLLLRICVRGHFRDIEGRVKKLVNNAFNDKSYWHMEWLLDILALWALTATNEIPKADGLLSSIRLRYDKKSKQKQKYFQRGLVLAEAMYEYGKGNHKEAFVLLGSEFDACSYKMIGASDEQLDVFNEVWYDVLLNNGDSSKAITEIQKSLKKREGAPFLWRLLEKAYSMEGMVESSSAAEKASMLEATYFID